MPRGVFPRSEYLKNIYRENGRKMIKHTEEAKRKIGQASIGRKGYWTGRNLSEETRKKMSEIHKRNNHRPPSNRGRKHTAETKLKMRERRIANPYQNNKNTSIEIAIENELKRRGIYYEKQVPLCKISVVDFYLPQYRIVIYCDGDYWHNLPGRKEKDGEQNKILTFNGFNVYRFWEYEIRKSASQCIDKVAQQMTQ